MKARFVLLLLISVAVTACSDRAEEQVQPVPQLSKEDGKLVYQSYCASCHDAGPGHAGTMRLAIRLGEEKSVLVERDDLNQEYVKTIVRQGIMLMPPFRPSEINDSELDALARYLGDKGTKG